MPLKKTPELERLKKHAPNFKRRNPRAGDQWKEASFHPISPSTSPKPKYTAVWESPVWESPPQYATLPRRATWSRRGGWTIWNDARQIIGVVPFWAAATAAAALAIAMIAYRNRQRLRRWWRGYKTPITPVSIGVTRRPVWYRTGMHVNTVLHSKPKKHRKAKRHNKK